MTDLIIRNDATLTANASKKAEELKVEALASGALIGRVANANENSVGNEALTKLQTVIKAVEKSRVEVKGPLITYGKIIDQTAKDFVAELVEEASRIGALLSDFAALERQRQQAAIARENERLTALEREREAELAKVKNHDEADAVRERFSDLAAQTSTPIPQVAHAKGQRVTEDWDITITDVHALYRMHSQCVELKPRLSEIKSLLNLGHKVAGVTAIPVVKVGVRLAPQRKAIEV